MNRELALKLQKAMNLAGVEPKLTEDGDWGPRSAVSAALFDFEITAKNKIPIPLTPVPPWLKEAKKYEGKNESDLEFNKFMSGKWHLVGLALGTIQKSWAAWCGLACAVALAGAGYSYQKNGAAARNWAKYGQEINWRKDGIPRGAIVHINHASNCNTSVGNHVGMADGDCTAADLLKQDASFNVYGGNQANQWKVSSFPVADVCAVRWPAEAVKPPPVQKSVGCSGKAKGGDTTR